MLTKGSASVPLTNGSGSGRPKTYYFSNLRLHPDWIRIQEVKKATKEKNITNSVFEELDILSGGLEVGHKDLRNTNFNKYTAIKRRNFFSAENLFNLLMFIINLFKNPIQDSPEMVGSGSRFNKSTSVNI